MNFKIKCRKIVIGIVIFSFVGLTILIPNSFVNAVAGNSPVPRYGHEMVYDFKNNLTILFGGENPNTLRNNLKPTWEFSSLSQSWNKISNLLSPSTRIGHGMVYNSISGKILLFGGMETSDYTRLNDMWEFDPDTKEWTELFPVITPTARSDHAMYFDSDYNIIVLFGGYLSNDQISSETWIYNCTINTWSQISPLSHPTKRYGHTFVYDENQHVGVFFGGRDIDLMSEIWFFNYSSQNWIEKTPGLSPIKRYFIDMVYNSYESNLVMFGGDNEQSLLRALDDTWIFDTTGMEWTQILTAVNPPPRNNHEMVFDTYLNKTLLFGGLGEDYTKVFGDFWSYDSSIMEWTQLTSDITNLWWIILLSVLGPVGIASIILTTIIIRKKKSK
jgi:N-acetylneuraminic acid mutarotase